MVSHVGAWEPVVFFFYCKLMTANFSLWQEAGMQPIPQFRRKASDFFLN